jgi:hypothetical protein
MALNTNFNVNPYYDDYDEDKLFLRMLFKPGYAVQARELTQLQTILQNQTERFGNHVFVNGSLVSGGQTVVQTANYLNVSSSYAETTVNINEFEGKTIVDNAANPTKRAEVVKVYDENTTTNEPKTIYIKQIYGNPFTDSETIQTLETNPVYANISTSATGTAQLFSVNEGIFYYEGFFIKNLPQTVALSKYTANTANVRVGFEVGEVIVEPASDTSLLDPAQTASNYQAPGSDRYKIVLTLSTRTLDSTDTTAFIEISQIQKGTLTKEAKYPLYSVLEDTLARRTYDESGNYTVRPFTLSLETSANNSAYANVILSPGKAYIYGYETETISPTVITYEKPRTTVSVGNKAVSADYGGFVYANTIYGTPPIGGTSLVDLHCVSNNSIERATAAKIANTKIGTARIKSIAYETATNSANANTYIYRTYLFDVSVSNVVTGYVNNTINVTTIQIANSVANWFSNVNNAYAGARFRISSGPGSNEAPKTIINYNGTNQTVTLSEPFITAPVAANSGVAANASTSAWTIDFDFNDAKSMVVDAATPKFAANIDERSKDTSSTFGDVVITDSQLESIVFPIGEEYIANNSITDFVYSYKKLYSGSGTGQTFNAGGIATLALDTGEALASATSTLAELSNYAVVVTDPTGTGYFPGQVLSSDLYSISGNQLTVTGAGSSFKANIIATIDVSTSTQKNKTLVNAAQNVATTSGTTRNDVFGNGAVILFSTIGQVHILANNVVKTPGAEQQLFISDVVRINSVFDFGSNEISTANLPTATNVTARYTLDTGQRDSFYDHASIKLKSNNTPPTGNLLVRFDHYTSSGDGYFIVTSYPDYSDIPIYTSTNQKQFNLRDCIDFRPIRLAATTQASANAITFSSSGKIPVVGSNINLDYQYYLPRVDKVILNKNKTFEVIQGKPSSSPVPPKDKTDSMTLYVLYSPAYVSDTAEVSVVYNDNKRYTMRDIGAIEKRVENLEYYTSLSLLEQDTLNKQDLSIRDTTGLQRFKNGLITDSFKGHAIADITKTDYNASIDIKENELRPSFNISNHLLSFDGASSSGHRRKGPNITIGSTEVQFIDQPKASKSINVNPFNVINYLGRIELDPKSDTWIDVNQKADVLVNIGGDKDAWQEIIDRIGGATQLEWDSWQNVSYGKQTTSYSRTYERTSHPNGRQLAILDNTTVSQDVSQVRSGVSSTLSVGTITRSIGDRIVDVSIIPYMRNRNVLFTGSNFKPESTMYSFFDSTNVSKYVARANRFLLNGNNLQYRTEMGNPESANIRNNLTSTVNGTCLVVKTSNDSIFVASVNPTTSFDVANANLIGTSTSTSVRIRGYEHYSGNANAATVSTITLRLDASDSNNQTLYANTANSNTIYIVSGTGAGQERTMNAYNAITRTANVSVNWTTTPDSTSIYSIGNLRTTLAGDVAGVFFIPTGTFRVGEKRFRLIDNQSGDLGSSATNGDASFFAQGLLQTKEDTIISATVPQIERVAVQDERVITQSTTTKVVVGYVDPLAQTFLVSPVVHNQGIYLEKIRLCFEEKDDDVPVTLQLRPAVNGYPSSAVVYPFSTVTLTPDKVNLTSTPDFDDSTKYTDFVFDSPVYVQPGEHSFVLIANSNKYKVWVAEKGSTDVKSQTLISEQPYGGSLFLSQNGSTWVADNNIDMMFRMYRSQFDSTATAYFNVNKPSASVPYDLIFLSTSDVVLGNTSIAYSFNSEKSTGGMAGYESIIPLENYYTNDGYGRRVLNPATGNNTFIVKATLSTTNPDISPLIDSSRMDIIAVENLINDMPLTNDTIIIANTGVSMQDGIYNLDISGGNGSGATVYANVVGGQISRTWVVNGGSGYTTTPTINLFASTAVSASGYVGAMCVGASSNGASITINGEDAKLGGNGKTRYMTRSVTLADGFESGDLRVYLTAYRPPGTNIYVYYKILSGSDSDQFDNKNYQLMTELTGTNSFVSTNTFDYRELTFAPGINNQANNSVTYASGSSSFDRFKTFSIKVVMSGTDTTDVPKIRDLRAIALPRG